MKYVLIEVEIESCGILQYTHSTLLKEKKRSEKVSQKLRTHREYFSHGL